MGALARAPIPLLALLLSASASSSAQDGADPFAAIESGDATELARVVDRLGDDAVLERLAPNRQRRLRLAAVRATPSMRWPELALPQLAELMAGRDPTLAPEAARALLDIVRALDADMLALREVDPSTLAPVRRTLVALAADATARPDLRAAAALADATLEALGAPAGG